MWTPRRRYCNCTIEVHAFDADEEDFGSASVKTVTFNDPEQADVGVAFP